MSIVAGKPLCADDPRCVGIVMRMFGEYTQTEIADALHAAGYVSKGKDQLRLTKDHVSNFMRRDLNIRSMPEHGKRYYREFQHDICVDCKSCGLWDIKEKIDGLDDARVEWLVENRGKVLPDELQPKNWFCAGDWERICAVSDALFWIDRFSTYALRLAST